MVDSSSEELSKEFSNLSTSSVASSIKSTSTINTANQDGEDDMNNDLNRLSKNVSTSDGTLSHENTFLSNSTASELTQPRSGAELLKENSSDEHIRDRKSSEDDKLSNFSGGEDTESVEGKNNGKVKNENEFQDSVQSRGNTFISNVSEKEGSNFDLEKEDSVLIEKDGKFELVDPEDLKAEEKRMNRKQKKKMSSKMMVNNRPVHISLSNPDYAHIQSDYAMSEQQREMKKRRITVIQMRKQEEKERLREEAEEQRRAAEKSFKKWISEKEERTKEHRQLKEAAEDKTQNEERQKAAEKAYNEWIEEKEKAMKEERRLEKLRIADEAQSYVVRDRKMCDKAFKEWLQKKRKERDIKSASVRPERKKSAAPHKKKSVAVKEIYGASQGSDRRAKSSTVRYADHYGYRHPASIDDFMARKW